MKRVISEYGMSVDIETDEVTGKHKLVLSLDVETGEFIVTELPKDDEVTKMIAKGVVALALMDCPESEALA